MQTPKAKLTRGTRAALLTLALASVMVAFDVTGWLDVLDDRAARPLSYQVRRSLDREPSLDPRLKLVVLDDIAVSALQVTDLSMRSWQSVLTGLARERPRIILIDKGFGTPQRSQDAEAFVAALSALTVPIAIGVHAHDDEIPGRAPMSLARAELDGKRYGPSLPRWLAAEEPRKYAYGPNPGIAQAFHLYGHILADGELRYPAFLRLSDTAVVPHMALHVAKTVRFADDRLEVDGVRVPLDRRGRMLVNLVPTARLEPAKIRLDVAAYHMSRGEDLAAIAEGDVVLVMPNLFTGGGDHKATMFGQVPGGYMITSLINSVLSGQWIATPSAAQSAGIVALLALLAGFVGAALPAIAGSLAVTALAAGVVAAGLLLFAFASFATPWVLYLLTATTVGYANVLLRTWLVARDARRVTDALGGLVAPNEIGELLRNPQRLDLRPRNVRVTVMFIDLVGFSRLAESVPAEDLFLQLKVVLNEMRKVIHKHGGFIDRSIGDGLLCFFGYRPDGSAPVGNHADDALRCAIDLQRRTLDMSLEAKRNGSVSYPMRIGLNTDTVCMGDLGDTEKIDFTVIGRGVNFAKRLESACDHFRIMLSVSTRKMLSESVVEKDCLHERFVAIKHHVELLPAYEYDPLKTLGAEKVEAMRHFWSMTGVQRKNVRHLLSGRVGLALKSPDGRGSLHNFSEGGLALLLDRYIACGAPIAFELDVGDDGRFAAECRQRGLMPLQVEVRWGEVVEGGFLHGVAIKSASLESRRWLYEALQEVAIEQFGTRRTG